MMIPLIIVIVPIFALFVYWVYRRKVGPLFVWLVLTLTLFCGSQVFPENRAPDQRAQLAGMATSGQRR